VNPEVSAAAALITVASQLSQPKWAFVLHTGFPCSIDAVREPTLH